MYKQGGRQDEYKYTRVEVPLESERVNAHVNAQSAHLAQLRFEQEITAIDEREATGLSVGLMRRTSREY